MSGFLASTASWIDTLLPALWRASWQGAIAITAVWLVARFFSLSPRVTCWAWRLVCLKVLIALVWMRPIELAVLPPVVVVVESTANVSAPRIEAHLPDVRQPAQPPIVLPAEVQPAIAMEQSIGWKTWLGFAWCVGVAFCIALTLRQWLHVCKLRGACTTPASDNLANWVAEEAERLRTRRRPIVLIANTEGPLLIGILRPAIVLPARAEELFSESELRLMLRHELAHLKRRDLLWNWLPTVVDWLFFFNPVVRLLKRGWFESQEAACDELLIQNQAARPAEYGRLLVKLATLWPSGLPSSIAAAGVLGAYQNLERRIFAMTHVEIISRRRLWIVASALVLTAVISILPWRLVAEESPVAGIPVGDKTGDLPGHIYTHLNFQYINEFGAFSKYQGVVEIDPNTGAWAKLGNLGHNVRARKLDDGIQLAFDTDMLRTGPEFRPGNVGWTDTSHLLVSIAAENCCNPIWMGSAGWIICDAMKLEGEKHYMHEYWKVNIHSKQKIKLSLRSTDQVCDFDQKRQWLATIGNHDGVGDRDHIYVVQQDGTDEVRITETAGYYSNVRFSPDGEKLAYVSDERPEKLVVCDLDGSNRKTIYESTKNLKNCIHGFCWSPDGKTLALAAFDYTEEEENGKIEYTRSLVRDQNTRIELVGVDGTHQGAIKLKGVTMIEWPDTPDWK